MDATTSPVPVLELEARDTPPARERWRLALCGALIVLGGLVLLGWYAHIEPLKSLAPGLSTMKVNTALCFVLAGAGIALAGYPNRPAKVVACATAVAVVLIGLMTLAEYTWNLGFSIDEALIRDTGTLQGSGHPGRMSIITATVWPVIGAAIVLLSIATRRTQILVAHALGSYAVFMSVLSAAGYTFGADAFRGIGIYAFIAVHTIVGLLIAAAAILLTKAQEGWLQPFVGSPAARDLLIRLLPLSMAAPLLLGLLLLVGAGLGAYNAAYAFALFIPATSLTMVLIALWVAGRQREGELVQRRYERHLQLVAAELNHRVKNTLSIVQSLAHQSWKQPAEAAKPAFDGRLMALATAHDMLTRRNWEAVSLGDVALASLQPHALCGRRLQIDGPTVLLDPKACVTLAMTFHELATNAVKYGALSVPDGEIDVRWTSDCDRLHLRWTERDGPPCNPPKRDGFGLRMLKRALASELGGTARVAFETEGLIFDFDAPLPR